MYAWFSVEARVHQKGRRRDASVRLVTTLAVQTQRQEYGRVHAPLGRCHAWWIVHAGSDHWLSEDTSNRSPVFRWRLMAVSQRDVVS